MCMGKELMEGKLYQMIYLFSEGKITPIKASAQCF